MGIGIGIGFYLIFNKFSRSQYKSGNKLNRNIYLGAVLFFAALFIFSSVLSPTISSDTDIHNHNSSRFFDEGEMATFDYVNENIESSSRITSDHRVVRYYKLSNRNVSDIEEINWPYYIQAPINNISDLTNLSHNDIVKQVECNGAPSLLFHLKLVSALYIIYFFSLR